VPTDAEIEKAKKLGESRPCRTTKKMGGCDDEEDEIDQWPVGCGDAGRWQRASEHGFFDGIRFVEERSGSVAGEVGGRFFGSQFLFRS
jgi:hypothetical protein